jgi:hypothetical protein
MPAALSPEATRLVDDFGEMTALYHGLERRHAEHLDDVPTDCSCRVHTVLRELAIAIREIRKEAWACHKVRL